MGTCMQALAPGRAPAVVFQVCQVLASCRATRLVVKSLCPYVRVLGSPNGGRLPTSPALFAWVFKPILPFSFLTVCVNTLPIQTNATICSNMEQQAVCM
jgi:hypothetical protein